MSIELIVAIINLIAAFVSAGAAGFCFAFATIVS